MSRKGGVQDVGAIGELLDQGVSSCTYKCITNRVFIVLFLYYTVFYCLFRGFNLKLYALNIRI